MADLFKTRIAHKRDSSANWIASNPVLLNGEIIIVDIDDDNVKFKIGDGQKHYDQIPFGDESILNAMDAKMEDYKSTINMSDLINDVGYITANDLPDDFEGSIPSNTIPKMNGIANTGSERTFARGDHIHPTDTSLIEIIYPVGSIYMSVSSTDPLVLFGIGEWERIEDTFLLAAGTMYSPGSVGGESEHTLTVEELPPHTHTYRRHAFNVTENREGLGEDVYGANNKTLSAYDGITTSVGGGQPHNNMPPYLTVYMWKRIS